MSTVFEGHLDAKGKRFALIVGRFNSFIVEQLVTGALDAIARNGGNVDDVSIYRVPGGFELPVIASKVAQTGKFDAIIALGAVIRGSTPHFDYIASEVTKGLAQVGLNHTLPIAFGVLTVDTIEQAIERAGTKAGNKGAEAAMSAIEMADLFGRMDAAADQADSGAS